MSEDDIFQRVFEPGADPEKASLLREDERALAVERFAALVDEVIGPVMESVGRELQEEGHGFEVVRDTKGLPPQICMKISFKGEEYTGGLEPSGIKYALDLDSGKVRMGGWITIPSKKNYQKVLAVALAAMDYVTAQRVEARVRSFYEEIRELTEARDRTVHIPVRK